MKTIFQKLFTFFFGTILFLSTAKIHAQSYDFSWSQNDSCPPITLTITNLSTDNNAYVYHWLFIGPSSEDTLSIWDTLTTSFTATLEGNYYFPNPGDSGYIQASMSAFDSMGNYLGSVYNGISFFYYYSGINTSVTPDSCTGGVGTAQASGCCNAYPYSYVWSNGSTSSLITGLYQGTYFVTMTDKGGCNTIDSVTLGLSTFTPPSPICIVSVDSSNNKNIIIWEELNDAKITSYNIYKETTTAGVYNLIGNRHVSELSIFMDSTSNPAQNAARYKISSLDTCGNESAKSSSHKTIHLTIGLGVPPAINLNWDNYEGINFGEYYIWRGNAFGNLILIDTIQSSLNSYTDQNPPIGTNFYAIQVVYPQGCTSSFKSSATYTSSFSNIEGNSPMAINNHKESMGISISPNPTNGKVFIRGNKEISGVEIHNLVGEKIYSQQSNSFNAVPDLSSHPDGIYFISIKSGHNIHYQKILKQ